MHKLALIVTFAMAGPSASIVEPAPADLRDAPHLPALVYYADPVVVDAACRGMAKVPEGVTVLACTVPSTRRQLMPNPCLFPDEFYAALQCHENAHLPRADGRVWLHGVR